MANMITDVEYANVNDPTYININQDGVYHKQDFIPYFNGKAITQVQEANAKEGWIVRIKDVNCLELEKLYGEVHIMYATPEHSKAFKDVSEKEDKQRRINKLVDELVKEIGPLEVVNVKSKTEIRLWKLGDLDRKILPTQEAVNKLAEIIETRLTDDGTLDIIWGPELNVTVIK